MHEITLSHPADFAGWRAAARRLLAQDIPPETVRWRVDEVQPSLFEPAPLPEAAMAAVTVPRRFLRLAEQVALHADPHRFALLYRLLYRLKREGRGLLACTADRDVARAEAMAAAVRRCAHKTKAFLRFKEVATEAGPCFVAWFEPEHHVLELVASFFAARLAEMRWSIATPQQSAHWDGKELRFGPGGRYRDVPAEDASDEAWSAYYARISNLVRPNLQEARPIPDLVAAATRTAESGPARRGRVVVRLPTRPAAAAAPGALAEVHAAAAICRACPLWERATRTVFGEGPRDAAVMLLGEQPGDPEDLAGRPFVGPAGEMLDRALADAGLDRGVLYLTNAVKHFKYRLDKGRRLPRSPEPGEVAACRPWLDTELALVRPRLIVALGAAAASALLGRPVSLQLERGRIMALEGRGSRLLATAHPASILGLPDPAAQGREYRRLVADLLLARPYLRQAA